MSSKTKYRNIEKKLIYFVTFFSFSGYNAGLALIISLGLMQLSRYYSIPLRLITTAVMIYIIFHNINSFNLKKKGYILAFFFSFWILYIIKVIYCYAVGYDLMRGWFEYIFYALIFCIFPFLMYASIDFNRYKNTILSALLHSGFIMAITCLYLYRDIITLGLGRISNIIYIDQGYELLSPLALSYVGALTIVLCIYKLFFEKVLSIKSKCFLIINLIVSFYIFFLGSSRGSLVAILLCIPLFFLFSYRKQKIKFVFFLVLSIPIFLWGTIETGSSILKRTTTTIESGKFGREKLWIDAWGEFVDYPLLGNRIEIDFYPHNFILETLMSVGFIGFLLLFIILFLLIKRVYQISSINKGYLIPFIVLLQGIAQYTFSGALYSAVLLFLPLGIIFSSYNTYNTK